MKDQARGSSNDVKHVLRQGEEGLSPRSSHIPSCNKEGGRTLCGGSVEKRREKPSDTILGVRWLLASRHDSYKNQIEENFQLASGLSPSHTRKLAVQGPKIHHVRILELDPPGVWENWQCTHQHELHKKTTVVHLFFHLTSPNGQSWRGCWVCHITRWSEIVMHVHVLSYVQCHLYPAYNICHGSNDVASSMVSFWSSLII